MTFFDALDTIRRDAAIFSEREVNLQQVERTITKDTLTERDFWALLSPAAEAALEAMAFRSQHLTLQNFGRTIRLYTPLYISDYCENRCLYCGFNHDNPFPRHKLSQEEIREEGKAMAERGFQEILVLTGESRKESPVEFIAEACATLTEFIPALSVEIYPLSTAEYGTLYEHGVNGLTIYQETYNVDLYRSVHPAGPKRNFRFRLEAPERGGEAHFRWINLGVLLGLGDWRHDAFALGLHARYLMDRFPHTEIGVGIPRLRPYLGSRITPRPVTDRHLVQILCSLRLFLPRLGISLTTREHPQLRDHLLSLGVTRLSAGSITSVGGHASQTHNASTIPQFEIADHRDLPEIISLIRQRGYDPVLHDWIGHGL